MNKWTVIEECNDENNNPTCWACEINSKRYGRYVWITDKGGGYDVEVDAGNHIYSIKKCKSLSSEKRWVAMNL